MLYEYTERDLNKRYDPQKEFDRKFFHKNWPKQFIQLLYSKPPMKLASDKNNEND